MAHQDDHLVGEFVHETIDKGRLSLQTIRYTDVDQPVLPPPPYADVPTVDELEKQSPRLPTYKEAAGDDSDDEDDDDSWRDFILRTALRVIPVLFCFYVIYSVISNALEKHNPNLTEDDRIARPWPPRPMWPGLDFVDAYPDLDVSLSSPECRAAWGKLTEVPCSSNIWSQTWSPSSYRGSSPVLTWILSEMCDAGCMKALRKAQVSLASACAGQAAFKIDGYKGRIDTTTLELDPSKVVDGLIERTEYMCRKSPVDDAERGFCAVDMSSRWGISDHLHDDGVVELALFKNATKVQRKEVANLVKAPDRWTNIYNTVQEERRYGPRKNSTNCSWCTLDWFKHKLALWDEKLMFHPGGPSMLSEFLRMWEKAGRRCEGDGFEVIFNAAVQSYKDAGLIDDSWEYGQSGRTQDLVINGPSSADFPLGFAKQTISQVKKYRTTNDSTLMDSSLDPTYNQTRRLEDEFVSCLEAFVLEGQELPCYPFIGWNQMKAYVFSSPDVARAACSQACFSAIRTLREKIQDACPSTKSLGMHAYDQVLPEGPHRNKDNFLEFIVSIKLADYFGDGKNQGSMAAYQISCVKADGDKDLPCAAIFAKWQREDWIFGGASRSHLDTITIVQRELRKLPPIPENLKGWEEPVGRTLTDQEKETLAQLAAWKRTMGEGVCSSCAWRSFVPNPRIPELCRTSTPVNIDCRLVPTVADGEVIAMEWIKTVNMLMTECAARGINFSPEEAADVNAAWIFANSRQLFDWALSEDRETPEWLTVGIEI